MTPENFCYWLQGFAEMNDSMSPTRAQWDMIQDHLKHVFEQRTAPLNDNSTRRNLLVESFKPNPLIDRITC